MCYTGCHSPIKICLGFKPYTLYTEVKQEWGYKPYTRYSKFKQVWGFKPYTRNSKVKLVWGVQTPDTFKTIMELFWKKWFYFYNEWQNLSLQHLTWSQTRNQTNDDSAWNCHELCRKVHIELSSLWKSLLPQNKSDRQIEYIQHHVHPLWQIHFSNIR